MRQARIVIDVDGVLAGYSQPMWDLLVAVGADMQPLEGEPPMWDWYGPYGASKAHVEAALKQQTPHWWRNLPAHHDFTPQTQQVLKRLVQRHEVTFITNRPEGSRDATAAWIGSYIGYRGLHVLVTPGSKIPVVAAMRADAIVEDRCATLLGLVDGVFTPEWSILVDRPYNREKVDNADLYSAPNTLRALQFLEETYS